MEELAVGRQDIDPEMRLEELIPADRRRQVWQRLRKEGFALPGLTLSSRDRWLTLTHVLHAAASISLWLHHVWGLIFVIPFGVVAGLVTRRKAVHVRHGPLTIWDSVIYLTDFREGTRLGYKWSHREVSTKVRLTLAESLGLPLDAVTENATLEELGAC
jgi:hypothetical protein